jgi:hypothetical protein
MGEPGDARNAAPALTYNPSVKGIAAVTKHKRIRAPYKSTLPEILAFHSIPEPNSGCLLWTASLNSSGYGNTSIAGKTMVAHRVAWTLARGPIPAGMSICHKCDVRSCINVDHLFLGTHQDNVTDMMAKGRGRYLFGPQHPNGILTDEAVLEIFSSRERGTVLAARHGIAVQTVCNIRKGRKHAHLTRSIRRSG